MIIRSLAATATVAATGGRSVLWIGNNHGAAIIRVEALD